jgi:hypothetical protein
MSFRTIAAGCALIGTLLALFIHYWLFNLSWFSRPEWYESEYLPFWVACVVFTGLAIWGRLSTRQAIISGLLVTAPPYSYYAAVALYGYIYGESAFPIAEYMRLTAKVGTLAISGAVLNPLLSAATRMVRASAR